MIGLKFLSYRSLYEAEKQRAAELGRVAEIEIQKREKLEAEIRDLKTKRTLYCSFCGKAHHDVQFMLAGPANNFICDECVELSMEIVMEKRRKTA